MKIKTLVIVYEDLIKKVEFVDNRADDPTPLPVFNKIKDVIDYATKDDPPNEEEILITYLNGRLVDRFYMMIPDKCNITIEKCSPVGEINKLIERLKRDSQGCDNWPRVSPVELEILSDSVKVLKNMT